MSKNQGGYSSQPMGGGYGGGYGMGGGGGYGNQTGSPGGYGMPGYQSSQNYGYRPQQYGGFGGGFGNQGGGFGGGFGSPMGGPMGNQTGAPQNGWWGSPSANTPYQNPGTTGTPNPFQGFPTGYAQQGGFSRFARTPPQRESGIGMSTTDLLAPPATVPFDSSLRDYAMQDMGGGGGVTY